MRLPLLTLLALLAVASPAAADSIVYVKDANVWTARPDGSHQRQLTNDGTAQAPYGSPSQADDGTIVAVRGSRFYKLDRDGRRLATLNSVLTDKPAAIGAVGPFDARISPDGRKIASWLGIMGGWYDYGTNTYYSDPESAIVFQDAGDGHPLGETMFYEEPSWLGDSQHVLMFDSMNALTPQVMRGEIGADHNHLAGWFHDYDTLDDSGGWKPLGAGELTRSGNRLAALRAGATLGNGGLARGLDNGITIYDVHGFDQPPTLWMCRIYDQQGRELTPPSWAPDGDALTWSAPDGIWTTPVGDGCGSLNAKLIIPGGREPDWGPADAGGAGSPVVTPSPPSTTKKTAKVRVARSIRRRELVRHGLAVRASCPSACRVLATAKARGRRVAKARVKGSGTVKAVLRVSRRAAKARTLAVRVTVRGDGMTSRVVKRAVRVR
jgi:hypothetical protein